MKSRCHGQSPNQVRSTQRCSRALQPALLTRHAATAATQANAATPASPTPPAATAAAPAAAPRSATALRLRPPAAVQQLAAAARSGSFFRVAGIQAQNAGARFGPVLVAAAGAAGTYLVWRSCERAASLVVQVQENYWALSAAVRP